MIDDNKQNDDLFASTKLDVEKIIDYRMRHRLTQKEFAARLGVTVVAISRWEKNRAFPSKLNLKRIAKEMKVNIRDLVIFRDADSKGNEKEHDKQGTLYDRHGDPDKAGMQIMSLLFEVHNLIREYISSFNKEGELAIIESILNNSLILVRNQKAEIQLQDERENL